MNESAFDLYAKTRPLPVLTDEESLRVFKATLLHLPGTRGYAVSRLNKIADLNKQLFFYLGLIEKAQARGVSLAELSIARYTYEVEFYRGLIEKAEKTLIDLTKEPHE